jgi:hypothetical protein
MGERGTLKYYLNRVRSTFNFWTGLSQGLAMYNLPVPTPMYIGGGFKWLGRVWNSDSYVGETLFMYWRRKWGWLEPTIFVLVVLALLVYGGN